MEIRVKVVEIDGKKLFEYQGVRFERHVLEPLFSPKRNPIVSIFRNGKLFDWGTIAEYKLFFDSKQSSICFFGFKTIFGQSAGAGNNGEFHYFELERLNCGDEIVQKGNEEFDYLRQLISEFFQCHWHKKCWEFKAKYPYPENWREDVLSAKKVWEEKIAAIKEELRLGTLSFLGFGSEPLLPEKKKTKYTLEVAEVDGQKMFAFQGLLFDQLPLIWPFYEADRFGGTKIEIWRAGKKMPVTIYAHEVGTHAAAMAFDCWVNDHDELVGLRNFRDEISAGVFLVGDRLEIDSPIELDLLTGLISGYRGEKDLIIAPWLKLLPESELTSIKSNDREFYYDMDWYFSWIIHERKVAAVKDGRIKVLRFSNS